jgi:primosomal protein N' (replication factor Y)
LPANAPQILSYYFEHDLKVGSILEIPINHRKVSSVVISSSPLNDNKILLKKSDYQIKKAGKLLFEHSQVTEYQLKIASWISRNYYSPLGLTLNTVLPPFFGKKKYAHEPDTFPSNTRVTDGDTNDSRLFVYPAKILIVKLLPMIERYRTQKRQVLILVPDAVVARHFYGELSRNALKVMQISGKLSNSDYYKIWNDTSAGTIDIIIGTRVSLFLPFRNLGAIIIEDSSNEMYKSDMSPKYHATELADEVARLNNADIVYADGTINVAQYEKTPAGRLSYDDIGKPTDMVPRLIDMKLEHVKDNFSPISSELKSEIIKTIGDNGRVLIYAPRRGYASLFICNNCGHAVKCPNCEIPMRVHRSSEYILNCHHCSLVTEVPKSCVNCNSSNMRPAGIIGSQRIYNDLMRYIEFGQMKKVPILILDSDVVKNDTEAGEIIDEMSKPGPSILIATAMVLSYRYDLSFDLVGITSIDALSNFTDFRTEEKLLITLNKLLDFNPSKCLLQTSKIDNRINSVIISGDVTKFYDRELKDRKLLFYPPFSKIVKMTFKSPDKRKSSMALRILSEKLRMAISQHKLENEIVLKGNASEYVFKDNNLFVAVLILKCARDLRNIRNVLRYVPNNWSIDINPNNTV